MGSFGKYSFFVVPHYERIGKRIATKRRSDVATKGTEEATKGRSDVATKGNGRWATAGMGKGKRRRGGEGDGGEETLRMVRTPGNKTCGVIGAGDRYQ